MTSIDQVAELLPVGVMIIAFCLGALLGHMR